MKKRGWRALLVSCFLDLLVMCRKENSGRAQSSRQAISELSMPYLYNNIIAQQHTKATTIRQAEDYVHHVGGIYCTAGFGLLY